MNHGIMDKSCVYGFSLESLSLLEGIKNFSGNKTLAMFLFEFAYNKYPECRGFEQELSGIKGVVKTESAALENSIKQMSDEFLKIDLFSCCNYLDLLVPLGEEVGPDLDVPYILPFLIPLFCSLVPTHTLVLSPYLS